MGFKNTELLEVEEICTYWFLSGVKSVYLREIQHNWEDDKAAEILQNIISVMSEQSQILIDDPVLDDM
ncbi:hypothetical protein N7517_006201 [Penicillium concentricum]|uniref:O-methyltransferase domain-containing protein n=1 Tax=Penicillium concentricum TaxID=293559 RepID=A0A9W9S9B1_9EURO|nr:uncharacterized protein N7517_006201 [Penicillium concentricum]KAJ5374195.1 hypothetical protein N7517_006201 [Penicillium concentricum]